MYPAEKIDAMNRVWHKGCFCCGGTSDSKSCKKVLTLHNYLNHDGDPFCENCHGLVTKIKNSTPKCAACKKSVFLAEKLVAINRTWHKSCFCCGGTSGVPTCKKVLPLTGYLSHGKDPFCEPCYGRLYGPKGVGNAVIASSEGSTKGSSKSNTMRRSRSVSKQPVDNKQDNHIQLTDW